MKIIKKITPIEQDFSKWYVDVITNGNLIEYGPVKGTIIFKPNSYGIWENIMKNLDLLIKKEGACNVYLPLLIPRSLIAIEKEHVDGFAPELATITKVGEKKLVEGVYLRPTSEVLFAQLFKSEINSYHDLPKIYNQWANIIRWEKTTNPFLRTTEFLWQEGHTSHLSEEEALAFSKKMILVYRDFYKDYLALEVILGQKTESEKFAGATLTWTIEAMMKDGKALQSATSHYLGQQFSRIYNVHFKDQNNQLVHPYQTSWGLSTRSIGAIIMAHGDNRGIVMPPKIAPIQVDLIAIMANKEPRVLDVVEQLKSILEENNLRVRIDKSDKSPGFKAAQSEIEGVPIRIEVGPRDLQNDEVIMVRRDLITKINVKISNVLDLTKQLLNEIHENLYQQSQKRLDENVVYCNSYSEFKQLIKEQKFVLVPIIKDSVEIEKQIKNETLATARCIPLTNKFNVKQDKCIITNELTDYFVIFARAY